MASEGLARREPPLLGTGIIKIDSRDIHPTLSRIKNLEGFLRSLVSDRLPKVFDIGGLFIISHATTPDRDAYQPTYYRVVLDVNTGAIWLFYEYYQFDPDFQEEKVEFCMNETLEERVDRTFDTAKVLDSIKEWRDDLTPTTMERKTRTSGAMARAYLTAVLSDYVEMNLKAPIKRRLSLPIPRCFTSSSPTVKIPATAIVASQQRATKLTV